MLLSFCLDYMGVSVEHMNNVLFDQDVVDLEILPIRGEFYLSR